MLVSRQVNHDNAAATQLPLDQITVFQQKAQIMIRRLRRGRLSGCRGFGYILIVLVAHYDLFQERKRMGLSAQGGKRDYSTARVSKRLTDKTAACLGARYCLSVIPLPSIYSRPQMRL